MKQGIYTITENRPLTADVWEMRLSGDTSPLTAPGQFINIKLEGFFLRRPISVCDWDEAGLTIHHMFASERQVAHALLTRSPLSHLGSLTEISELRASFDLHVLGTPPAFVLSQDQTLK